MTPVAFRAGRACGNADTGILQNVDGVLGGDTGNGQGKNVRCIVCAVDYNALRSGKLGSQFIQQFLFTCGVCPESGANCCAGSCEAENGRSTLRTAAVAAFLTAAQKHGAGKISDGD